MLTEVVQPEPNNGSNSETDLGALAEHLSIIADALRKSTGNAGSRSQESDQESGQQSVQQAVKEAAQLLRANPLVEAPDITSTGGTNTVISDAPSPLDPVSRDVHSDLKMKRRRYCAMAREAYAVRRRRSVIFKKDELFGEPAWDILLDLYIAHSEGKSVSVSSACIGSAAPPTTGLRWLGVLSEHGLILREHDPEDQRRVLVCLTEKGLTAMDTYFASLGPTG